MVCVSSIWHVQPVIEEHSEMISQALIKRTCKSSFSRMLRKSLARRPVCLFSSSIVCRKRLNRSCRSSFVLVLRTPRKASFACKLVSDRRWKKATSIHLVDNLHKCAYVDHVGDNEQSRNGGE